MKILSLDSSSPVASVAVVSFTHGPDPVVEYRSDTPHARSDSSALFAGLEAAVAACGLPDALCVGTGPGSYNGLRAGIAAARGFSTALGIPLHAIPSPLSLGAPDQTYWAVGDARGGHYWIACVGEGSFLEEPVLLTPRETAIRLESHSGLPILGSSPLAEIPMLRVTTPDATRLAILSKKTDPLTFTPEPLYLKPPHITAPRPIHSA